MAAQGYSAAGSGPRLTPDLRMVASRVGRGAMLVAWRYAKGMAYDAI